MNRTLIIRLCLIAFFLLLVKIGWDKVKDDIGMMFIYFIGLGVIAGLLVVKYVLPWFGDAVGTVVYSSGEEVRIDGGLKAAAKLAQGDYEGAIAEHEKSLARDPAQSFPVAEIAKICAEKLGDPKRGIKVLETHLAATPWTDDDATFLRFRMVGLHLEHLHDFAKARTLLEKIVADFSGTRHSANAHHLLGEVDQAEFKFMAQQRAKAAQPRG